MVSWPPRAPASTLFLFGMTYRVARCSEFPNDNPWLHEGSIDRTPALTAETSFEELVAAHVAGLNEDSHEDTCPSERPAVQTFPSEEPATATPSEHSDTQRRPSEQPASEMNFAPENAENDTLASEDTFASEDAFTPFEVVDELGFEGDFQEDASCSALPEPTEAAERPAPAESYGPNCADDREAYAGKDAYAAFVLTLRDVAAQHGAGAAELADLLARLGDHSLDGITADETAVAWRAVLRGESEDYGPCGATPLDLWAANLVASSMENPALASSIRSELRRRGVAAFGFANAA